MNKHFFDLAFVALAAVCLAAFATMGCQSEPVAPQLPMVVQQPVVPVVAPVPPPPPPAPEPPATPLVPIVEEAPVAKAGGGGGGVCKNIPGIATPGDEILGNYTCKFDVDLPFGMKPPAFDCALRRQGDGAIRIMPAGGAAALNGPVTETKTGGFRLDATWTYPGIKLRVGSCMMRKGTGFQGSGQGILNDDKNKKTKFKLTMTR